MKVEIHLVLGVGGWSSVHDSVKEIDGEKG